MRTYYTLRYAHQAIAVVAIIIVSFGVKILFLSAPTAEADIHAVPSAVSMDLHEMQIDHPNRNKFPLQKMQDMTFIFSDSDDRMSRR